MPPKRKLPSRHGKQQAGRKSVHSSTRPKPTLNADEIWLYGNHAVLAALANPKRKIMRLCATASTASSLVVPPNAPALEDVPETFFYTILPEHAVHQGIAALAKKLPGSPLESVTHHRTLLVLDHVTDPQNIGAILRSAAAFNVGAVILQDRHSPPETGALAKTASGALETIPMVRVTNISATLDELKQHGYWCAAMDGTAQDSITALSGYDKLAIVMGAEGRGMRPQVAKSCDLLVKIPYNAKAIESLNVSSAAAIAMAARYQES